MPKTTPLPDWGGEDVFIVGGGPSLEHFDWDKLKGLNTIGCNAAFKHGADVINIAIFGDFDFWQAHLEKRVVNGFKYDLDAYDGWVATNYQVMNPPDWLKFFVRQDYGLSRQGLAWNNNTGCAAVNLALLLGAHRVYLLGFDMCQGAHGKTHWHEHSLLAQQGEEQYQKFMQGFNEVARNLRSVYPGREVFTATDGTSRLQQFPRVPVNAAINTAREALITG